MALRTFHAFLDDAATIRLLMEERFDLPQMQFTLESATGSFELFVHSSQRQDGQVTYYLTALHAIDLETAYTVYDQDRNHCELGYGHIVRSSLFDSMYRYDGLDLGATYTPTQTTFKLWAPISRQVLLILEGVPHALTRGEKGVWHTSLAGDLDGQSYHYLHRVNGEWLEVHDPYAISSKVNSGDSYVINPAKLRPATPRLNQVPLSQAILYEMSVRDFSWQKEAGFVHRGHFLGLSESPQLNGFTCGKDYVKQLGVTHIQLMPVYDFGSVDETYPQLVYNWGYDPVQYNVPEGSFTSQPDDPYTRILELQTAIQSYQADGIGVIMDVVYNHVYHAEAYAFERLVPGYFYRYDGQGKRTEGTFCGNDVASERSMVSNYIRQSLRHWVKTYGLDGFRFDLMGILDCETMQQIERDLKPLHPSIYLYGEGWQMATGLPSDRLAHQYNAAQLPGFGFFNDDFRDTFKTIIAFPHKLVEKQWHEKVQNLLAGSRNSHFVAPGQSLNYIECHDNATAFDYFHLKQPDWSKQQQKRAASFALQLILISQGVAFLHSGQECFRTKDGLDNTYNSPDRINRFDWTRASHYQDHVDFVRQLIAFRKNHPSLSYSDYVDSDSRIHFYWLTEFVLSYRVTTDQGLLHFLINFSDSDFVYENQEQQTTLHVYPPQESEQNDSIRIAGQTVCILVD